ncbi:MAG: M14 family zinc carboxypeptidase, partial [bacterium]
MRRYLIFFFPVLFVLCLSAVPVHGAWQNDEEIEEYLEKVEEERKKEKKKEREERLADPHRRLRPYQTLEEINEELDKLLSDHPKLFTGGTYGKSVEGRDLRWIRMNPGEGSDKPELLISANIHAQEMAAGQMVMYLLRYFAENYGDDCKATRLANSADIYFVPVMNPDRMAKTARMQSKYGITGFLRKNKH